MDRVEEAAQILRKGGVVIFPTDTVYGIGCRVEDQDAIERLYQIKQREEGAPTIILTKNIEQAKKYALFNEIALDLAEAFWPGPLTLVTNAKDNVPRMILGKGFTVGMRIPNHGVVQKLIGAVGEPILAPSANFRGDRPPIEPSEIDKKLINLVDYVLEYKCGGNKPSTIVEVLGKTHRILRLGAIGEKEIQDKLKEN